MVSLSLCRLEESDDIALKISPAGTVHNRVRSVQQVYGIINPLVRCVQEIGRAHV